MITYVYYTLHTAILENLWAGSRRSQDFCLIMRLVISNNTLYWRRTRSQMPENLFTHNFITNFYESDNNHNHRRCTTVFRTMIHMVTNEQQILMLEHLIESYMQCLILVQNLTFNIIIIIIYMSRLHCRSLIIAFFGLNLFSFFFLFFFW